MDFECYRTWSIIYNDSTGDHHIGSFESRKRCIEYLKYRKELLFFDTGSMEEAERQWGLDNFKFEQTLVIPQDNVLSNFKGVDLNNWNMDL